MVPADDPDQIGAILRHTGPRGADAVIEAVGLQVTVVTAQALTRRAARSP